MARLGSMALAASQRVGAALQRINKSAREMNFIQENPSYLNWLCDDGPVSVAWASWRLDELLYNKTTNAISYNKAHLTQQRPSHTQKKHLTQ